MENIRQDENPPVGGGFSHFLHKNFFVEPIACLVDGCLILKILQGSVTAKLLYLKGGEIMIYADLVFKNGQVITVNPRDEIVSAVAILGNRICYVGSDAGAMEFAGPKTRIVDLKGRSLTPGFNDAHIHTGITGLTLNSADTDCGPERADSIEKIKEIIHQAAQKTPKGTLIRSFNYNHNYLKDGRHPTKWDLDEAAPDHPVLMTHASFHFSVANSKALELAGITNDTPDPEGGVFERRNGELTGLAIDNAHGMLYGTFPFTEEEMREGLKTVDQAFLENGITSVQDAGANTNYIKALIDMGNEKVLKARYYFMLFSFFDNKKFINRLYDLGLHTGLGSDRIKMGPLKIMLDGSSICGTVAMKKPYNGNANTTGTLTMTQEELNDYVLRAHQQGFQVACHAIGDKAIEMIINAYEAAQTAYPRGDCRHRIEHCTFPDAELIERIAKNHIVVNTIPECVYSSGDAYIRQYGDRMRYGYAQQAYIKAGAVSAFSSDAPIAPINPMQGLYSACHRVTYAGVEAWREEEVSLLQAIRMYTLNGAYLSFDEKSKGSIEVGKLADLAVLSAPILDIPLEEVKTTRVDMTVVDGEICFER